jgi:site-specific DNA-cytosine methylase
MRFQSIPDHFEVVFRSQDERNALIGNAVPSLLARALAFSVKRTLSPATGTDDQTTVDSADAVQLRLM